MTKRHEKSDRLGKLRERAEQRLNKILIARQETPLTEFEALKQLHELQVSQIELELQNSELLELQLAREELSVMLERYTKLYEFAPMGYFTVCREGLLREANLNGAKLLGVPRSNLVNRRFRGFVAVKCRPAFNDFLAKVFSSQSNTSCELEFVNANKQPFIARIEASADDSGQKCFVVVRDISARKIIEEALHDVQKELKDELGNQTVELVRANELLKSQVAEQMLTEQVLQHTKETLRDLGVYQDRVKEEERKRIAREIHDELGGLLTCIKAHMSVALVRMVRAGQPEDPELITASALADSAIETVRRVVSDLRPSVLDQLGVWAALEWYADQFTEQGGLICEFRIDAESAATEVDPERSTALYRIVQEAITNVVRHSEASRVSIRVTRRGGSLTVEVEDNGKGIATERLLNRESFGIVGMRERARNLGGELTISGEASKGTLVVLRMPLGDADGE